MVRRILLHIALPLLALSAASVAQTYTQSSPQICCGVTLDNGSHYSFELYSGTSAFVTNVFGNYVGGTDETSIAPVTVPPCNRSYAIPTTFSLNNITLSNGHTGSGFGGLSFTCFRVPTRNGGAWVSQKWVTYSELTFN